MSGILPSGLRLVAGKLKDLASDIVTVRTGTVVSDYASMSQTLVTLDNDPEQASVQALALNGALPSGARVLMIAYPPRGLAIFGMMDEVTASSSAWQTITSGPTAIQRPTDTRLKYVWLEAQGGGGAGGGAAITGTGNSSAGSGGAAGMWTAGVFTINDLTWPLSAVGGSGGAGVSGAAGNAGTESYVQHSPAGVPTYLLRAPGGVGGTTLPNAATPGAGVLGGLGNSGLPFVGQRLAFGGDGETATRMIAAGPNLGGHGGGSFFGGGGRAGRNNENGGGAAALGAGGGGATNPQGSTANTGGSGQIGAVYYRFF